METNEIEWGAPITVNGKRPDWLDAGDMVRWCKNGVWKDFTCKARDHNWGPYMHDDDGLSFTTHIRLHADHPYYARMNDPIQSAIPTWALEQAAQSAGFERYDNVGYAAAHSTMKSIMAHARTLSEHVTPPDPMIKDREFVAGMLAAMDWNTSAHGFRSGHADDRVSAALAYLRENKEKI